MALTYLERLFHAARFRVRMIRFALTVKPVAGAEDDPDPEPDPKPDPDPDPDPDPEPIKPEDDWKAKARKHERALKAERKAREEMERKLREREDADKSETEKAIEKAREEARTQALTEAEKERRKDKLEVSVTRLSSRGFEIGEGDEKETVKFADPDDAMLHVERAIDKGDLDADEIFDSEGRVNADALQGALAEILESKPHLRAAENGSTPRPKGGAADAGKGGSPKTDLEAMSPADHERRKYGDQKDTRVEPARARREAPKGAQASRTAAHSRSKKRQRSEPSWQPLSPRQ